MKMAECPVSGLILPQDFVEAKHSLKKSLNEIIEKAINSVRIKENYFLVLHAKFDPIDPEKFVVSQIIACLKLPSFTSNQQVYFISPRRGIKELLWMVAPKKPGEKLQVEFNKSGVAYLQAKGAMPS
jgi:hypothetical protein